MQTLGANRDETRRAGGLSGRVALVTGAGAGIGRGCALALAAAGATVIVNDLAARLADSDTVARIEASGGRALPVAADVSSEAEVETMVAIARERCGTLDILVNNAGIERDSTFLEMTLADWQRVLAVNLTGQFLCARAAVREFLRPDRAHGSGRALGNIVCISSVHRQIPWARHVNYATSKGGLTQFVRSLAQELATRRIRVNAVAPGAIRTAINRAAWETEPAMRRLLTLVPYGRIGEPEDVAAAVLWLASDASDYVTGTTLTVDGGMSLYPAFATGEG